jgi:hypothetical protein
VAPASAVPLIFVPSALIVAVGVFGAVMSGGELDFLSPLSISAKPNPIAERTPKPALAALEEKSSEIEKSEDDTEVDS